MLICILSTATVSFAQTSTTSLRGVIKDPSGALVPGAKVSLVNGANGTSEVTTANNAGYYLFAEIPPAKYTMTVTAAGFGTQIKVAELLVSQPATIDFTLTLQSNTVTVDVSASAQTLNLTDATIGNSVDNSTIQALPMDGRDPIGLLSLQPGVLYIGSASDSRQGAVAGGRSDQGNVTLDGLDDNDEVDGVAFQGVLRSTMDSTEEFRVTTSDANADAGRSSGAQVSLITKSGTNKFHGSLYEYYRPTNTIANDWFLKESELSSGLPNKPDHYVQNVFGGAIGGPIKKDKLFFFFNYEGFRKAINSTVVQTVPSAPFYATGASDNVLGYIDDSGATDWLTVAQVNKLDQSCTQCTAPGPNPLVQKYFSTEPVIQPGQGLSQGDGVNSGAFTFSSPAPSTLNTSIVKLDYDLNSHIHLFARGNLQKDTSDDNEQFPGQPPSNVYENNTKGMAFGVSYTPTSTIVNDLRYGYVRQGFSDTGVGKGDYVSFRFYTQPQAQTRDSITDVPVNNILDNLNWTKGNHSISLGGNWRGIQNNYVSNNNSFSGATTNPYWLGGNPPDPASLGLPAVSSGFFNSYIIAYATLVGTVPQINGQYNYAISSPTAATLLADGTTIGRHFHENEFEYYLQDSWHIRPNLMITFGLRHTILQTPYDTKGQQVAPTIDTDAWFKQREKAAEQGQVYEPDLAFKPNGKVNDAPGYWAKQKLNLAPRLAVVWAPNGTTSIRAGAGMYYDHFGQALVKSFDESGSFGLSTALSNPAGVYTSETSPRFTGPHNLPNISVGTIANSQTFPYSPPDGAFLITWGIDNKIKTPYSESFDFSIQKQLPGGFLFEQAYVGRLGRHLLQELDLAEPVNYNDPKGAGDYFTNGALLSKYVDQKDGAYGNANNGLPPVYVPKIQYFEDLFPGFKNQQFNGESATESIYNLEWAPYRYNLGETTSLADIDFYCPYYYNGCNAQPLFWQSQFSSLYAWDSIGVSSYNALQFTLRHPQSHGFTTDVSYTFSKSIDMGSLTERANEFSNDPGGGGLSAIQNTWRPKLNKAVSDFDTHSLITADWAYALPFGRGKPMLDGISRVGEFFIGGWQWAGLGRWTSGLPFTVNEPGWSTDWQLEGAGVQTGPVKLNKHISGGFPQIFDANTANAINGTVKSGTPIRMPYPGEAGDRNHYRGDGYIDIDSSLSKVWNLTERAKLKFAGEVYNISNTPRFDVLGLGTQLTSGNLGYYSSELTQYRRIQLGLRIDF
jgi:Carboxypeptidase regulatory-like domain